MYVRHLVFGRPQGRISFILIFHHRHKPSNPSSCSASRESFSGNRDLTPQRLTHASRSSLVHRRSDGAHHLQVRSMIAVLLLSMLTEPNFVPPLAQRQVTWTLLPPLFLSAADPLLSSFSQPLLPSSASSSLPSCARSSLDSSASRPVERT